MQRLDEKTFLALISSNNFGRIFDTEEYNSTECCEKISPLMQFETVLKSLQTITKST